MRAAEGIRRDVLKATLSLAWPAVLESFFVALAGLVDSFMVSSLGSDAVAAVGLTTQPKFVALSLFFALNLSVSALVARRYGQKKRAEANQIVCTALCFLLAAAVGVSALFVLGAGTLMRWCGSTVETHGHAVTYFQIIMGGMVFNCVQMCVNAAQRGCGNTQITMRTNLVSNTVNIAGNYLLIGGRLGFPRLGIAGAALATVLGTVVSCVMSIRSICRADGFISVPFMLGTKLRASWATLRSLAHVGYSVFLEQLLMRVGFLLTALMAAGQGNAAMAAHQVCMNLLGLSFSFGDGLQVTAVALIGRSLGEGNPDLARAYGKTCRMAGSVIAVVLAAVYLASARPLMGLFFAEPEIVAIGVRIMHILIFILFFQISQVVYMGSLRGAGDTLYTAVASTVCVTLIRTAGSYVCGYVLGMGIAGIWLGILADQVGRFAFSSIRFRLGRWTRIRI